MSPSSHVSPSSLTDPTAILPRAGGLNFDAKIRRESSDIEDLFIGHINGKRVTAHERTCRISPTASHDLLLISAPGMDCYARGLRAAAKLLADGTLDGIVKERYSGFDKAIGAKVRLLLLRLLLRTLLL